MKKNCLNLFFTFFSIITLFLFNSINVQASCYKICYNDDCFYSELHVIENDNVFPELVSCIKKNGDICYDNITYSNVSEDKCNFNVNSIIDAKDTVSCGNLGKFHRKIPQITSWAITLVQIVVPVLLVIFGIVDFVKSISSQKEDEIKNGQRLFIKKLIIAFIIFLIVAIAKLVVGVFSNSKSESKNIINCIECFVNNKCN